jgi:hypothetical protein
MVAARWGCYEDQQMLGSSRSDEEGKTGGTASLSAASGNFQLEKWK